MARTLSLFEAATGKGRIVRMGEVVQLVMDGAGAFVCNAQEFTIAQKWAQSKTGSGNAVTDRGRFIEKIEVLIARPASFVSTRGSTKPLETLAKNMKQAGFDLGEWMLPPEITQSLKVKLPPPPSKPKTAIEAEAASGDAAASSPAASKPAV